MEKRRLGDTGIDISVLGLGTVKFGRNQGVKYPSGFELPDDATLRSLLLEAQECGINLLDTAPAYGLSEARLGSLLKGQRQNWVIAGKAGEEFEAGRSFYNFTPEHFTLSLERSLQRLQTDYLDILLIHSDGDDLTHLESRGLIDALEDFKARGLVRAIGASTKTVAGGLKALEKLDVVMATYNQTYTEEAPVLDEAYALDKGIILKKALASGHAENIESAIQFALSHKAVSSMIIGTINPAHLRQNVQATLRAISSTDCSDGE